ncbi:MAG: rhizobiocin/RTX toxin and hemolysin-type calcium binding protein [Myxococcales bacterium]|nr:rhizobiocin/RTX toxin and hemolysin-type calcium binding protein [Myxococcales bacterium]
MRGLYVLLVVAGCADDSYIIVTVDKRPAVHDAKKLAVTLSNEGSMRAEALDLTTATFPVTFSISAPGRAGDLGISIDATDSAGLLVGHGSTTTPLLTSTASLLLDSADFVVNTDVANDQFLSDDFEAVGLQLAAAADGTWMAGYRDSPCTSCSIWGRRFDVTGAPLTSAIVANDHAFQLTTTLTQITSQVALASAGGKMLAFWDFADTVGSGQGIACRSVDMTGTALPSQLSLATEPGADVVSATALSNGNFAIAWNASIGTGVSQVRTIIARPDCMTVIANPVSVSATGGMFGARRAHVAANGMSVLYAWILDNQDVHVRGTNNGAGFMAGDVAFLTHTATDEVSHVRVAPLGAGFAVVVRWSAINGTGPGKIELYRSSPLGVVMGGPTLITDKSGSDFLSNKAFGVATRSDGALMVVWHQCDNGGGSCEVFGRLIRPTGAPVGDAFPLATTTINDQINPSVVAVAADAFVAAWNDSSTNAPDPVGTSVRARVIYPAYDSASAVLGAKCGGSLAACATGLACAMGTDGDQRCYATCTGACPAGGTCTAADTGNACTF